MTDDAPDGTMIVTIRNYDPDAKVFVPEAPRYKQSAVYKASATGLTSAADLTIISLTKKLLIPHFIMSWTDAGFPTTYIKLRTYGATHYTMHGAQYLWDHGIRSAKEGFVFCPMFDTTNDKYALCVDGIIFSEGGGDLAVGHSDAGSLDFDYHYQINFVK